MQAENGTGWRWRVASWLLLLASVALAYETAISLLGWDFVSAIVWGMGAGLTFQAYQVCRRQALGWVIDSQGERQKVVNQHGGTATFLPTSRDQRLIAESTQNATRRKSLLWTALWGCGLAGAAYYVRSSRDFDYLDLTQVLFWALAALSGISFLCWFWHLAIEVIYQFGWQDMEGAKVLDEPPPQPGLQAVIEQKAHGDARPATESETLSAAVGGARRSSIHDQEF